MNRGNYDEDTQCLGDTMRDADQNYWSVKCYDMIWIIHSFCHAAGWELPAGAFPLQVGSERHLAPELLFRPELLGQETGGTSTGFQRNLQLLQPAVEDVHWIMWQLKLKNFFFWLYFFWLRFYVEFPVPLFDTCGPKTMYHLRLRILIHLF